SVRVTTTASGTASVEAAVIPVISARDRASVRFGRRSCRSGYRHNGRVDEAVRAYIDAIPPGHRPLFDRLHRLVLDAYPDATVVLSYQMPTYRVGRHRLYLATWAHGVSLYGWSGERAAGFL